MSEKLPKKVHQDGSVESELRRLLGYIPDLSVEHWNGLNEMPEPTPEELAVLEQEMNVPKELSKDITVSIN